MKRFTSLNIVINSNGVVRVNGNGGMVFEVQADYVKVETLVDCTQVAASGTIPKSHDDLSKIKAQRDEAINMIREYCDFHQIETPAFNRLLGRRELSTSGTTISEHSESKG